MPDDINCLTEFMSVIARDIKFPVWVLSWKANFKLITWLKNFFRKSYETFSARDSLKYDFPSVKSPSNSVFIKIAEVNRIIGWLNIDPVWVDAIAVSIVSPSNVGKSILALMENVPAKNAKIARNGWRAHNLMTRTK